MSALARFVGGLVLPAVLALVLGVVPPTLVAAQTREETLADIRQQLTVLYVEVQKLKRELSTTGGVSGLVQGGGTLQRADAIEQQLQRLISKTEELEFRVDQVVTDGTNRIGDLEFRLCELEAACDPSKLGDTPTLGGGKLPAGPAIPAVTAPVPGGGAQMAISEQADYDHAKSALDAGSFRDAADAFASFTETYPGGPLSGEAHFYRGVALSQLGETANAARAYLESFSGAPDGALAPQALFELGMALDELGQKQEACVTLGEVPVRFPDAAIAVDAEAALQTIGCN